MKRNLFLSIICAALALMAAVFYIPKMIPALRLNTTEEAEEMPGPLDGWYVVQSDSGDIPEGIIRAEKYGNEECISIPNNTTAAREIELEPGKTYRLSVKITFDKPLSGEYEFLSANAEMFFDDEIFLGYDVERPETENGVSTWFFAADLILPESDEDTVKGTINLYNHLNSRVYFSDIMIEERDYNFTNTWKIGTIIYRDADADMYLEKDPAAAFKGKSDKEYIDHYKAHFSYKDINYYVNVIEKLPFVFEDLSDGRIVLDTSDIFVMDKPLQTMSGVIFKKEYDGHKEDWEARHGIEWCDIKQEVEELNQDYDVIIVIAPFGNAAKNYWGIYDDVHDFISIPAKPGKPSFWRSEFKEELFVHEFCHAIEAQSDESYPALHDSKTYGYWSYRDNRGQGQRWYSDWIQGSIDGYKGGYFPNLTRAHLLRAEKIWQQEFPEGFFEDEAAESF